MRFLLCTILYIGSLYLLYSQTSNDYLIALQSLYSQIKDYGDSESQLYKSQLNEDGIETCMNYYSDAGCVEFQYLEWNDIVRIEKKMARDIHRDANGKITYSYSNYVVHLRNMESNNNTQCKRVALRMGSHAKEEDIELFIKGLLKYSTLKGGSPKYTDVSILDD